MGPLIGIPPCLDERDRWRPGRAYHYIDRAYAAAIEAAGGVPVYLPAQADARHLVERIDGLLLPGGDDLAPEGTDPVPAPAYPSHVHFDLAPESQIAFDAELLERTLARELPVLAICYGMQLLVRRRGGALLYHIPSDAPQAGEHRLPEPDGRHGLRVEPGTRLAAALGEEPGPVNSLHHQGVREPGEGLRVAARAEDGLIEAVEAEGDGFCVGVQWHPEKMRGPHRDRLFGAFVAACAGASPGRNASDARD
jgi:putative glutamine amidotransferase